MKKLSQVLGKSEEQIVKEYALGGLKKLFEGLSAEDFAEMERKMFSPLVPYEDRIESPRLVKGRYLAQTDVESFQEQYCQDCTLGDHAGCGECRYLEDITL